MVIRSRLYGNWRHLYCENLESRLCLSTVSFAAHAIPSAGWGDVYAADMDGDGDVDVLSGGIDESFWFENIDGNGTFGLPTAISTATGPLRTADLDGDGDLDVLSAGSNIRWYENTDGQGTFGPEKLIQPTASLAALPADVDGDGDVDVIAASDEIERGGLNWYENADGQGSFGVPRQKFSDDDCCHGAVIDLDVADLDNDGDVDVISGLSDIDIGQLNWYENIAGHFGFRQVIHFAPVYWIDVADIDSDGDADIIHNGSFGNANFRWAENNSVLDPVPGPGFCRDGCLPPRFSGREIESSAAARAVATDVDNDGDVDLFTAGRDWVAWHENTDGQGNFGPPQVIGMVSGSSLYAVDIDRDGDEDLLVAGVNQITWYENMSSPHDAGDANRDGVFNQLDIVQVLQTAKYLTGERATFDEGDWNEDGVFNQLDIVAALQTGNYLNAPGLFLG